MSWAHYLLQVNIYLIVFFCFYRLLLDKETYFVLNRVYLVGSGVLSLIIPFLRFEWLAKQNVAQQVYITVDQLNGFAIPYQPIEKFNWGNLIVTVYLIGILFFIVRFIFRLIEVHRMFNVAKEGLSFSFLNKKVIAENMTNNAIITAHEDVHIRQKHTLDILFFELLAIFTWFNPIIYLYKLTIKNIHEFLADEAAAGIQGDKESYALLLLGQAFSTNPDNLTSGFFTKSLLKKRIFMLHKQRSKKTVILKYGLFVPLFALTLVLSSGTIRKNDQLIAVASKIPLNNLQNVVEDVVNPLKPKEVLLNNTSEKRANMIWKTLYQSLGDQIKGPIPTLNINSKSLAYINFRLEDGQITTMDVKGTLQNKVKQELIKDLRSFKPSLAAKDGDYSIQVVLSPEGSAQAGSAPQHANSEGRTILPDLIVSAQKEKEKVYQFVTLEQPPTYPGGMNKFYAFLSTQLKYPDLALASQTQGTVLTSFIVEKDGTLSSIKVERELGFGLDEEAIRVLKQSPNWIPGHQNGRAVRVRYSLPIRFAFNGSEPHTSPIVIVDGQKMDHTVLKALRSENLASVDVLKPEAGIALYGAEAKDGVIIISTKKKVTFEDLK